MIVTLLPVGSADDFDDPVLRSRAGKAPLLGTIRLFRAMADGVEAGMVVLDVHAGSPAAILYEVFLCSGRRGEGIGSKVLAAAEAHTLVELGRAHLEVWPRSVDRASRSDAQLVRWYRRHGYEPAQAGSGRLRKVLRSEANR